MEGIFITGTAAYGPFTDQSDVDMVVTVEDAHYIKKLRLLAVDIT